MAYKQPAGAIGIFDSGVGGLSVLRHVRAQLPGERIVYIADQAHVPYGSKSPQRIQAFAQAITQFLIEKQAELIVVACNAASAAALDLLREIFPDSSFVGMEPAVKPAATGSRNGVIGVLATPGTFGSHRYARLMARYAQGVLALEDACTGLVEQIEAGDLAGPETRRILRDALEPMIVAGVDNIVLGCTHYPFVQPLIRQLVGPDVAIIDPAPAVARQARRVLKEKRPLKHPSERGEISLHTSGDAQSFASAVRALTGLDRPVAKLNWMDGILIPSDR